MFHKEHFCHISSTNRGCPQYSIYVYKTTDSVETMLTEGYFNEALLDLQKNDVIAAAIISETDSTEYERVYFRVTQRTLDTVAVQETHSALIDEVESNLQSQITTNANNIAKLQTNKADKTTDFETPITASNKGATMMEINNLVQLGNKITNCILQLPQIDLSIQGGELVLASGTKVYVANNGVSTLTTSSELTYSTGAGSGQYMILLNGANAIASANLASCSSGTLAQRPTNTPTSSGLYYATDTQTMYNTSNYGSTWNSGTLTLPIAIATVSNGKFTSVTPFNGVGYIGTTLFSVPDLLISIPNGRNSDGTLNNVTNPQTDVNFYTLESFTRTEIFVGPTQLVAVSPNTYTYDFEQNKVLTATGDQRTIVKIGTVSNNGSTITGIDLDEPFAAVDYNEYVKDLSNINKDLSNINEVLEDKASLSEPQTIDGEYTFTKTIDSNATLGMQINQALDSNGTTAWRVYDATNSRQIRSLGFYANSKIYNRLSIVGKTGVEGYLNFSMTDDGTMNIELSGTSSGAKEYLPPRGDSGASFATTKWVQRELGDYAQNDLSNISAEGIDTAVGWGIPDYSAGVESSTVLPSFTCDQDYLFIFVARRAAEMSGTLTIKIDNNLVAIITSDDYSFAYLPLYVRKGSVVTTSYSNLTTASCTRFPLLKGA